MTGLQLVANWLNLTSLEACGDGHQIRKSGSGLDAQRACIVCGAVHMKKDQKWVLHSSGTGIANLSVSVQKSFPTRRDAAGLPTFTMPPSRLELVDEP